MRFHVDNYNKSNDADLFIENLLLSRERPSSILGKLRYLLVGDRSHMWMYDGNSLCSLLLSEGFKDVLVLKPGELNFQERMPESVLVEAVNPYINNVGYAHIFFVYIDNLKSVIFLL